MTIQKKGTLYKLQAEKEFEVYSKIWDSAVELRISAEQLRPSFEILNPDETQYEKWSKRYKRIVEKNNELQIVIEKYRPFYPHELYLQLRELILKVNEEIIDFEHSLDEKSERMSFQ